MNTENTDSSPEPYRGRHAQFNTDAKINTLASVEPTPVETKTHIYTQPKHKSSSKTKLLPTINRPSRPNKSQISVLGLKLITAWLFTFLMFSFVLQFFSVPSQSMEPTLKPGDRLLVVKPSNIDRGDIIVFSDPDSWLRTEPGKSPIYKAILESFGVDSSKNFLVKRVIGLPGDHITSDSVGIKVNGVKLNEPYVKNGDLGNIPFDVTVPKNKVWLMGDNRNNSSDSRYHTNDKNGGFVPMGNIVGTVEFVVWPISRFSRIDY